MPKQRDLSYSIKVDRTPEEAFRAINDVRGWWSGNIQGATDKLGSEWTYRYEDLHYSKQRITELTPGKRVVWGLVDRHLKFVDDKTEWNGTKIVFDIARKGGKTEVKFTHVGLVPTQECYPACSDAWGSYIRHSLRILIVEGQGHPNPKESAHHEFGGSSPPRNAHGQPGRGPSRHQPHRPQEPP